ncbi:MAG: curli-like amyloid fiber formation chaperone CsgH [Hyphomicrobiaceae bacterium]
MKQSSRLAIAATTALAAIVSTETAHAADGPLVCEIRHATDRGLIQLSAVAIAGEALRGAYQFTLEKTGPGGSSRSANAGAIALDQPGERTLTRQTFNLPDGATAEARLVVTIPGKAPVHCALKLRGGKAI